MEFEQPMRLWILSHLLYKCEVKECQLHTHRGNVVRCTELLRKVLTVEAEVAGSKIDHFQGSIRVLVREQDVLWLQTESDRIFNSTGVRAGVGWLWGESPRMSHPVNSHPVTHSLWMMFFEWAKAMKSRRLFIFSAASFSLK